MPRHSSTNMSKLKMSGMLGTFMAIILCLALTPSVAQFTADSIYIPYTQTKAINPAVSNSTSALTYAARNDTAAWWRITLNATDKNGQTAGYVERWGTDYKYVVSSGVVTFTNSLVKTTLYLATITYYYVAASSVVQILVGLIPLFWIVAVLAIGVAAVYIQLKTTKSRR